MELPNLPSRFENFKLSQRSSYTPDELERLKAFIFQIEEATKHIRRMIRTMEASNSGAFLILMGESGIGKTTFLNTLPLYIENLEVSSIYNKRPLDEEIDIIKECDDPRIIILENRETFETLSTNQLEKEIHAINRFVRSDKGRNTIIVWPCNGEDMTRDIIQFAGHVGGSSLFREDTVLEYKGPSRDRFVPILKNTFEFFNKYDISEIGFSDEQIENVLNSINKKSTIGDFIEEIRTELLNDYNRVEDSWDYAGDFFDLIICVVACNNPKNDIEYLTKGDYSTIDIDRLFSATSSNIKITMGKHKRICTMVAKEVNCKIISIDWQDALDILRIKSECKDAEIERFDKYIEDECKLKLGKSKAQLEILSSMNLTSSIKGLQYKRRRSPEDFADRKDAFNSILELSRTNDSLLNKKLCKVLKDYKIINVGRVEDNFGSGFHVRSDMICSIPGKYFRVEFMWRETASAADIALYTLKKLYGYCQAMRVI